MEDGEQIAVTVASIYRELSGDQSHPDVMSLLGEMAALAEKELGSGLVPRGRLSTSSQSMVPPQMGGWLQGDRNAVNSAVPTGRRASKAA